MKKKNIISAVIATVLALAPLAATPAFAANTYQTLTLTEAQNVKFKKYLVLDKDVNVPEVTFDFTTTNAEEIGSTSEEAMPVIDGETRIGELTVSSAVFAKTDNSSKVTEPLQPDPVGIGLGGTYAGKAYVEKEVTVELAGTEFTSPGVYRWKIVETIPNSIPAGYTYDSTVKYLDVIISQDTFNETTGTGTLKFESAYMHNDAEYQPTMYNEGDPAPAGPNGGKTASFINLYETITFTLKGSAQGNQADHTEYIPYKVKLNTPTGKGAVVSFEGPTDGKYDTTGTQPDGTPITNPTEVTINENGEAEFTIYLQPGQEVNITGLPADTKIQITQDPGNDYEQDMVVIDDNGNPVDPFERDSDGNIISVKDEFEDYIALIDDDNDPSTPPVPGILIDPANIQDYDPDDIPEIKFVVIKSGLIPTGILTTVLPGAAILSIGGAGLLLVRRRKKESEDEE